MDTDAVTCEGVVMVGVDVRLMNTLDGTLTEFVAKDWKIDCGI